MPKQHTTPPPNYDQLKTLVSDLEIDENGLVVIDEGFGGEQLPIGTIVILGLFIIGLLTLIVKLKG